MAVFANKYFHFFKNHTRCVYLCFSWILGLCAGCGLYHVMKPSSFLLMRSAILQPVSIVGLFASVFLPLICSYFSILTDKPIIIWIVCFLKAVAFGFSGVLVSQCFYDASWLVRFLFLFSDSCFLVVLFSLWFRRCANVCIDGYADFAFSAVLGFCIAAADYFVISPFLMGLF